MTRKLLAFSILPAALLFGTAHAQITLNTGGSSLAGPTYTNLESKYVSGEPTPPAVVFNYEQVGSGSGQLAFLDNDITQFLFAPAGVMKPGTATYGTVVGTQVDFAASDAPLSASQLVNGGANGAYANSTADGPLIQIPTFGVPVTLAYNESGEKSTLTLTDAQICGVLSGQITDWHSLVPAIPMGTKAINVGYFSNSSGTTYLITQHLNAVCNSGNSNFANYPVAITKTFQSLFPTTGTHTIPNTFHGFNASTLVANYLVTTSDSFGYLSPDYTSIAPKSTNTTKLKVASVVNPNNNTAYAPTVANTETGLKNPGTGSKNTSLPSTLTAIENPLNWVPSIPQTKIGYPIVGYSTLELSTCYASATAGSTILSFIADAYTQSAYQTLITNNGFAPLGATNPTFGTAIENIFVTNTSKDNLNIDNKTVCASYQGR